MSGKNKRTGEQPAPVFRVRSNLLVQVNRF
jgi:hypothetical protein